MSWPPPRDPAVIAESVIALAEEAEREGFAPENSPDPEFVILARAYLREAT